jgi:hypothetical protein
MGAAFSSGDGVVSLGFAVALGFSGVLGSSVPGLAGVRP